MEQVNDWYSVAIGVTQKKDMIRRIIRTRIRIHRISSLFGQYIKYIESVSRQKFLLTRLEASFFVPKKKKRFP